MHPIRTLAAIGIEEKETLQILARSSFPDRAQDADPGRFREPIGDFGVD